MKKSLFAATAAVLTLAGPISSVSADEPQAATVAPKAADSDAPLPVGFPPATAPNAIEVKPYPAYRSAMATGEGMTARSGNFLFWALFQHISKKGVEMTAPVINTYDSKAMIEEPGTRGTVSMEFLYQRPDQGETGPGVGAVKVVDHQPGQYVCHGIQGEMDNQQMQAALNRLEAWLVEHKDEWTATGPPRSLGYHGPMTPVAQRLWELQIPIAPVAASPAP
jgi:hypothetical protein